MFFTLILPVNGIGLVALLRVTSPERSGWQNTVIDSCSGLVLGARIPIQRDDRAQLLRRKAESECILDRHRESVAGNQLGNWLPRRTYVLDVARLAREEFWINEELDMLRDVLGCLAMLHSIAS